MSPIYPTRKVKVSQTNNWLVNAKPISRVVLARAFVKRLVCLVFDWASPSQTRREGGGDGRPARPCQRTAPAGEEPRGARGAARGPWRVGSQRGRRPGHGTPVRSAPGSADSGSACGRGEGGGGREGGWEHNGAMPGGAPVAPPRGGPAAASRRDGPDGMGGTPPASRGFLSSGKKGRSPAPAPPAARRAVRPPVPVPARPAPAPALRGGRGSSAAEEARDWDALVPGD